jgi:uncharacterized membrane protein YhhN
MQFYFAIALTLVALVTWGMSLRSSTGASRTKAIGLTFAPLLAAWLVALLTPAADNIFYKGAILLGMLLAFLAFLVRQSNFLPSYLVHAHLLLTYALYALAFASQTSGWPTPWALLLIAVAGFLYYFFYPTLFELWSTVAIYGLLIFLAAWQALELALQQPNRWMGWIALVGILLLTVATLLEAQARFRPLRPTWALAATPVSIMAQLLIAWSIWG